MEPTICFSLVSSENFFVPVLKQVPALSGPLLKLPPFQTVRSTPTLLCKYIPIFAYIKLKSTLICS